MRVVILVVAVYLLFGCLAFSGASANPDSGFAVYVPGDLSSAKALTDLLDDPSHPASQVSGLKDALASDAGVLILWRPEREASGVDAATLNALRKRKVIAVGRGSAMLFGRLGLEINDGAFMLRTSDLSPTLRLEAGALVAEGMAQREIVAFTLPSDPGKFSDYNSAMYIPAKSHLRSAVEVIGRWSNIDAGYANYAPIVRQGNYLMIGFAAPVSTWTDEYKNLFRELGISLLKRPPEPFPTVKWDVTKPGAYEFRLARFRSTTDLQDKTLYFTFKRPTTFSARIDTKGSSDVMLQFMGTYKEHWIRKDARLNEAVQIEVPISDKDVKSSAEGHWKLHIANFDAEHEAECTLTIAY